MKFKAEINIDHGVDKAGGINKNMFFAAEPYTHNAGNNADELQRSCFAKLADELIDDLGKIQITFFRDYGNAGKAEGK